MGEYEQQQLALRKLAYRYLSVAIAFIFLLIPIGLVGCPQYHVWQQGLEGQAALKRAEQTRMIQIEQAKGEEQAALHRANAIKTLGQAAKDFPEYRYQEFLGAFAEALHNGTIQKIIFVPTEAQIPITEAGRSVHVPDKK
jgi:hypothetical protein